MNDLLRQLILDVVDGNTDNGCFGEAICSQSAVNRLADYLVANPPGPKDPIVVILSGERVEDVQIPYEGYSVEVRDYDIVRVWKDYADPDDDQPLADWTEADENGDRYAPRVWQV